MDINLGEVLRTMRIGADMTQQQVADYFGRSQNVISSWECNKAQPDVNTLFEMFRLYERSPDEIMQLSQYRISNEALEVGKAYDMLDKCGREAVSYVLEREKELQKREEVLNKREADLRERESKLREMLQSMCEQGG